MSGRILVVDDEVAIQRTLRINLRARGYEVETVGCGRDALAAVAESPPDLIILDLGLPDIDGVEVLRRLRATSAVQVIVLSARHQSDDKVEALDEGADDFVTKPFGADELMARVRVAMRRTPTDVLAATATFECDDFRLDFAASTATVTRTGQAEVHLMPTEWQLLAELARQPDRLVSHQALLKAVWGPSYGRESNYLRVYANQIRRKLEPDPSHPRHLLTEPGLGYRLTA